MIRIMDLLDRDHGMALILFSSLDVFTLFTFKTGGQNDHVNESLASISGVSW